MKLSSTELECTLKITELSKWAGAFLIVDDVFMKAEV
jgi:hypothetical protein